MMLCVGGILALTSCADDPADGTDGQRTHTLRLSLGTTSFQNSDATTRSTTLPTGFEQYNHVTSVHPIMQIQGYMTYDMGSGPKYISCLFNHVEDAAGDPVHTWQTKVPLYSLRTEDPATANATYHLYGFMPKVDVNDKVTVEPYDDDVSDDSPASFDKGAVLTMNNLNALTANDICVIVGLKGYGKGEGNTTVPSDMSGRLGYFDYYPETEGDYIFLLVDHLYAGLQFNMRLGPEYSKLRSIKVKNLKLKSAPVIGESDVVETVTVEVTIAANTGGDTTTDPLRSVVIKKIVRGTSPMATEIYNGEPKTLPTGDNYENFFACLCPSTNQRFILETTYDVYDKNVDENHPDGNLISKDRVARNEIGLTYDLARGQMHHINITVEPTYLYVMSDPDLNNPEPKFVVN